MNFIDKMPIHTAVKVGSKYVVQLHAAYHTKYSVCDVIVGSSQVVVDSLDDVKKIVPESKYLIEYKHKNSGEVMSPDAYSSIRNERNTYFDDDADEYIYPSLDVEFAIRKKLSLLEEYEPVYGTTPETKTNVDITLIGTSEYTGSDFIKSAINYGVASFNSSDGLFMIENKYHIVRDEVLKLIKEYDVTYVLPDHSGLRFLKVRDKYVFSNESSLPFVIDPTKGYNKVIMDNLDSIKRVEQDIRKDVRNYLEPILSNRPLNKATTADLQYLILRLKDKIGQLSLRVDSSVTKSALLRELDNFQEKLK